MGILLVVVEGVGEKNGFARSVSLDVLQININGTNYYF